MRQSRVRLSSNKDQGADKRSCLERPILLPGLIHHEDDSSSLPLVAIPINLYWASAADHKVPNVAISG